MEKKLLNRPARDPGHPARLAALTFLAVCGSIVAVGLVIVPLLIRKVEQRYLHVQADINARQARALARFATLRLSEGSSPDQVSKDLQVLLAGADAERGFSCVVDQGNSQLVCHPMPQVLGMSVAGQGVAYASLNDSSLSYDKREPWEEAIGRKKFGPGTLAFPDGKMEIIHMEEIPGTMWTVVTHENTARVREELGRLRRALIFGAIGIGLFLAIPSSLAARWVSRRHEKQIEEEQKQSERLLLNILPPTIAERLKANERVIADRHSQVTVLFADIVGFTPLAAETSADQLVDWLDRIFSRFDDICAARDLEKIKTIGDAYMLCGGLNGDSEKAAEAVISAGLEMIDALDSISGEPDGPSLELRIGVHTGELVAGVIGKRKFSYDLWGDVVNTASRLESNGVPGRVQVSSETADRIREHFELESRGEITVKGKGDMTVWLVKES